nr:lytic transglycosylase domain-containing protein [Agrobacterium rubi]
MPLRTLVFFMAIILSNPAFPFDYSRFYSDYAKPARLERLAFGTEKHDDPNMFEVWSTSRGDNTTTSKNMNTSGSYPIKNVVGTTGRRSNVVAMPSLNKLYSFQGTKHWSANECGPSSMTTAEIEELVARTAQTHGVDPRLAKAIAWNESRFDQDRNSPKGARGPMQLMPATAIELGVKDICDPAANIDGGIRYLKLMLKEFQNPILAVAAYNSGAQTVYDNGGIPPFGETVRYVAAVINHQMGLQMPHKPSARRNPTDTISPSSNEMASDVIGARSSRFIKGVMQF